MVMILAMIFGAHLLPYGWLYQSRSYMVFSIVIPIAALIVGVNFPASFVAGFMIAVEIVFSLLLMNEVKKLPATGLEHSVKTGAIR
jgi:TRAP-type C4-dicarboxylate transport system permease small subunit